MKTIFIYERYSEYTYISGINEKVEKCWYSYNLVKVYDRCSYSHEDFVDYFRGNKDLIGIGISMLGIVAWRI